MSDTLPPLPVLFADTMLEVCTHPSLSGTGLSDNSRLAIHGEAQARASLINLMMKSETPMKSTDMLVGRIELRAYMDP